MAGYERTRKGLRNSFVAVAVQVVSLLVGFFSRKIFLDYLGTEVLGLNSTASSLLNFLNLAEMGIETAIAFTLYKPLFDKDEVSIREIIAIQGWFYRRVALFIIAGSLLLMPFFPLIFTKMQLPMWYAYASYLVLLFSALLGYFVNYKQVILTADQQDYKFQMSYRLTMILKVVFQMVSVKFLAHPYVWWLIWEAVFAIVAAWRLNSAVYRNYPFLKQSCKVDKEIVKKYPEILTKIKQVFVHRIGFFATLQATPVLIYSFTSLSTVAMYGNYKVITDSLSALIVAVFANLNAGIGNTVAEGNNNLVFKIFKELFTARFAIVVFCCLGMMLLSDPFVKLWIGPEYVLSNNTLILIVIVFYLSMMNHSTESFLNAFGMFSDVWVPLTRAAVYIALSIFFGRIYGLNGVLLASAIDNFWVTFIWKPLFLFRQGLNHPIGDYISFYFKLLLPAAVAISAVFFFTRFIAINPSENCASLIKYSALILSVFCTVFIVLLIIADKSICSVFNRIKKSFLEK